MVLRRTVLSLVLVGASLWCTGLVRQAYSEQQREIEPPNAATPVAAPDTTKTPDPPSDRLDEQLAGTPHANRDEALPAG